MNLLFDGFEVAGVAIAAALANLIIQDGESTWLEGTQLWSARLAERGVAQSLQNACGTKAVPAQKRE
jgi:hypothetical protein